MWSRPSISLPTDDVNVMKLNNGKWVLAGVIGCATICVAVNANELSYNLPPEMAELKPGDGMDNAVQCVICHSADYISTQPRLTRAVWQAEVTKMRLKYGANITTNSAAAIVDYLVRNYGQENAAAPATAK